MAKATDGTSISNNQKSLLIRILLHLVVEELQLDASLAEQLLALSTDVVLALADHTLDAAVDDEHGTGAAGSHAAVERGAVEGDAATCGLADGVLLGMYGADTVCRDMSVGIDGLAEEVAHLVAMWKAAGRAHIARHQQLLVLHDDAA